MSVTSTLQEVTTVQDDQNIDMGNYSTMEDRAYSDSTVSIVFQVLIGSLTLLGNVLFIRILCDLRGSKLRKTTTLLLAYVSVSFCVLSIAILGRLFKMPCAAFLALVITSGINILNGMLYLALETFFIVNRPHTQHKFVSMKICTIEIVVSFVASIGIGYVAHVTKKMGNKYPCFITNGKLHPVFVIFTSGLVLTVMIVTSVVQFRTLRAMRNVSPINTTIHQEYAMSVVTSNPEALPGPVPSQGTSVGRLKKSPLHKLTTILCVSLLCFVICWTPLMVCFLVFSLCQLFAIEASLEHELSIACSNLVTLNGCFHTLIYFVMSTQIRQMLIKYCKKCLCLSHN